MWCGHQTPLFVVTNTHTLLIFLCDMFKYGLVCMCEQFAQCVCMLFKVCIYFSVFLIIFKDVPILQCLHIFSFSSLYPTLFMIFMFIMCGCWWLKLLVCEFTKIFLIFLRVSFISLFFWCVLCVHLVPYFHMLVYVHVWLYFEPHLPHILHHLASPPPKLGKIAILPLLFAFYLPPFYPVQAQISIKAHPQGI